MSVQGKISDYYLPCPALTYDCGHKLPLGKSNVQLLLQPTSIERAQRAYHSSAACSKQC